MRTLVLRTFVREHVEIDVLTLLSIRLKSEVGMVEAEVSWKTLV